MLRFFLIFLSVQAVLFTAELTAPVQEYLVIPFTERIAELSAYVLRLFDDNVASQGKMLWNTDNGFAVSIEAGCNGVEATIVLFAAMVAFPAPLGYRLTGVALGALGIQILNLARIITLFYIGQWDQAAFQWAHLYIWQALIMLDVLVIFLVWLRFLPPRNQSREVADAA
jgi:exosortase H (IPTLxxWG-CTERM-specific)